MSRDSLQAGVTPEQEPTAWREWLVSETRTDGANLGRLTLAASALGIVVGAAIELVLPGVGEPIAVVSGVGGGFVGGGILVIDKITR